MALGLAPVVEGGLQRSTRPRLSTGTKTLSQASPMLREENGLQRSVRMMALHLGAFFVILDGEAVSDQLWQGGGSSGAGGGGRAEVWADLSHLQQV